MKSVLFLFLILVASVNVAGQNDKSFEDLVNAPIVLKVSNTERVRVFANLKYSQVADPNLLMDIYVPEKSSKGKTFPIMLFLHGGAGSEARAKDWGIYRTWGRAVAASGVAAVVITHRLGYPKPNLEAAAADVRSAMGIFEKTRTSTSLTRIVWESPHSPERDHY